MKTIIYTIIFIVCLAGGNITAVAQGGNLLTFDVEAAIDNKKPFDISNIADGVEFIPLEISNNESLISDYIMYMEESETGFYILDISADSDRPVKIFDRKGKFLSTMGRAGRGPGEYISSGAITVDPESGNVYMSVKAESRSVFMYNRDNRMTASTGGASDSDGISYYEGRLLIQNFPYIKPDADGKVSFIDIFSPDLKKKGSIRIPHKATNNYMFRGRQILSNNGKNLLIKEELNDTLFHYRNERLLPAYKLDMGKYFFSQRMWNARMEEQWNRYYQVYNVYDGDRYMIIELMNGFLGARNIPAIFDKRNFSKGFTAVGPNGKPGFFIGGVKFTPRYIRDNRLVGYMQSIDIVDNAATIANPALKALAATLKEDSNPVIVVVKLKK